MKIWRVNLVVKDSGNPPYTDEMIRVEFQNFLSRSIVNAEVHVMDVRELIPETFQPLVPKERIERTERESQS